MFLRKGSQIVFKMKLLKKLKLKKLKVPKKAPTKFVGTFSDRLGTIWDAITHIGEVRIGQGGKDSRFWVQAVRVRTAVVLALFFVARLGFHKGF